MRLLRRHEAARPWILHVHPLPGEGGIHRMSQRDARRAWFAEQARKKRIEQSHFNKRVRERLWPVFGPIDPMILFQEISEYIASGDPRMSYVGRISRYGRRLWRLDVPQKGHFYIVVQHDGDRTTPMTILMPGMRYERVGKAPTTLE